MTVGSAKDELDVSGLSVNASLSKTAGAKSVLRDIKAVIPHGGQPFTLGPAVGYALPREAFLVVACTLPKASALADQRTVKISADAKPTQGKKPTYAPGGAAKLTKA